MNPSPKIAVLGAGHMGSALIAGWRKSGLLEISATTSQGGNREAASAADIVVVAVKPYAVQKVVEEIRDVLHAPQILISVAARVPLAQIQVPIPVYRAIPNLAGAIGKGATGIATNHPERDAVRALFERLGVVEFVSERELDVVTALSGSGPAYACLVMEALAAGGVHQGLRREPALRLAAQTMLGAASLVLETGIQPGALSDQVVTPGGTTIAGLAELEKAAVRAAFMAAVEAGVKRCR